MAENTIKFTKDEVSQINTLRQNVANVFTRLGQLQIEKKRRIEEIENLEKGILQEHSKLIEEENKIFQGLNEKYGDGNYDPNTNEFIPAEKENTNTETSK
tara:strand:+ start:26 stop:325 length:300 start_codon:yes stop_codon:yes gene_type:complete